MVFIIHCQRNRPSRFPGTTNEICSENKQHQHWKARDADLHWFDKGKPGEEQES